MKKVVVFDLGGTLMTFKNMPPVWIDSYKIGLNNIHAKYRLGLSNTDIEASAEIMKALNPRVNYREKEISPSEIFRKATAHWHTDLEPDDMIECFFAGIHLETQIYDYALDLIADYRSNGYCIACLTDLPSGMPDCIFKRPLQALTDQLDLYVSSQSCGYRKPNPYGLQYIADYFSADIKNLLFIGDEQKDKRAAQNAGCQFMFIGDVICQE